MSLQYRTISSQILRQVRSAILKRALFCERMKKGYFEHMLWKYDRLWTYCARLHDDVIFHLRVLLRNMTSIRLLSLTFRKNRLENVVEYGSKWKSILKNLTRQKWNLKSDVEVHVIYNFYCFYMFLYVTWNETGLSIARTGSWIMVRDRKRSERRKKTSSCVTQIDLFKTKRKREKDIDYWQNECVTMNRARILQNWRDRCVTMHGARILQKNRTNALRCTERVYYRKTERVRYNAQSAYITERQTR